MSYSYNFRYAVMDKVYLDSKIGEETVFTTAEWYYPDNNAVYPWYQLQDTRGNLRWILAHKVDVYVQHVVETESGGGGGEDPPPPCPQPPC